MTKTTWMIIDEEGYKIQLGYYHFGKAPQFPKWYMEDNHTYTIEMLWNFRLILKPSIFLKCLTHQYIIKNG